jgi:hypothetical protein
MGQRLATQWAEDPEVVWASRVKGLQAIDAEKYKWAEFLLMATIGADPVQSQKRKAAAASGL